eukprot:TRINITY_DN4925_c0_g1_i3.p1 TRINITY_DN4925_c0_g1~~TRINITY_DN4925_c0_g1_i3.p1  ORF type:complete len:710 (+),score=216.76 TRINITY_DN4925_c0_g1_i3:524-2653(+)
MGTSTTQVSSSDEIQRGEIDTSVPFESVKAAVSLSGEKAMAEQLIKMIAGIPPDKIQAFKEAHMDCLQKETQLHLLQRDLLKLKEELKKTDGRKQQAQNQLEETMKTAEDLPRKIKVVTDSAERARRTSEITSLRIAELQESETTVPEAHETGLQSQFLNVRDDQMVAAAQLETAKRELRKLKQELQDLAESRVFAVQQAEEAMAKGEIDSARAKDLQKEIDIVREAHAYLKRRTLEIQKEISSIESDREAKSKEASVLLEKIRKEIESLSRDISTTKDLEQKFKVASEEVRNLQQELETIKKKYREECSETVHPIETLREITGETLKTKKQESEALSSLGSKMSELENGKGALKKVTEEILALKGTMDLLESELEKKKLELAQLNEIDTTAESRAAELNAELHKAKSKLTAVHAAEQKAKDSVSEFAQTIQQLLAETEESMKETETHKSEAQRAKLETEKANAGYTELEQRLQLACKELSEAKGSETVAMEQIKVLFEKASAARASSSEADGGVLISQTEYDALVKKVEETESLADKRVAAVMAQLDAVRAGDQELQMKLEAVNRDIEHLKSAEESELQVAQNAEAAKRAIEGELKRRRERELQKHMPKTVTAEFLSSGKPNNDAKVFAEEKNHEMKVTDQLLDLKTDAKKQEKIVSSYLSQPVTKPLQGITEAEVRRRALRSSASFNQRKKVFRTIIKFFSFGNRKR